MTSDGMTTRDPKGTIPVYSAFTTALEELSPGARMAVGFAALRKIVDYFAQDSERTRGFADQAIGVGERLETERDAALVRADKAEAALARLQSGSGMPRPTTAIGDLRAQLGGTQAAGGGAPGKVTRAKRTLSPTKAVPKPGARRRGPPRLPRDEFGKIIRSNGSTSATHLQAAPETYGERVVVPNEE